MGRVSLPAALSLCALVIGSWDGGTAHGFLLPPPPSSQHSSSLWRGSARMKNWKSSSMWSSEWPSRSRARWSMSSGRRGGNNDDSDNVVRRRGSIDLQPLDPIGLDLPLPPQPLFTASARDVRAAFKRNSKYGKGAQMSPSDLSNALKELGVVFTEGQLQAIVDDMTDDGESPIDIVHFERAVERMVVSGNPRLGDELGVKRKGMGAMSREILRRDREKEGSRQFRRTYFSTYKDWLQLRSSYRLFDNLSTLFTSTVVSGLWLEISTVLVAATVTVCWNAAIETQHLSLPLLSLPLTPITIVSPSLGLLLVFRTSGAYARYTEAVQTYALTISYATDIVRNGCVFFDRYEDKEELGRRSMVLVRALKRHVRGGGDEEKVIIEDLRELIGEKEAARILSAKNRPIQALMDMSRVVDRARVDTGAVRPYFEASFSGITRAISVCERLYRTPIPLVYTRHTGRFLGVYMLLLPMALWGELGGNWAVVPASVTIAVFLFGIEELGIQIEEPFSILPLDSMCDTMQATIADLLRVEDPDNPSHVYSLGYDFLPPIGSDAKPLSESPLKRNYSGGEDRSRDYSEDSEEETDADDDD